MGDLLYNRYELVELLGEGRQGAVYQARDHWDETTVAIKILKGSPDPQGVRMWADLRHPNVVRVLDVFFGVDSSFVVMEYVAGPALREAYLRYGEETLLRLLYGICHALRVAHSRGICHGDIKPPNILIESESNGSTLKSKLTDFGLWRTAGTQSKGFSGTLAFAAPEALRGEPLDSRSDLYSLGATLYEVLTGRPVFGGKDLRSVVESHLAEDPIDPREFNPSVSDSLAALIRQMLAKNPSERPRSAAEIIATTGDPDIDPAQFGEPSWTGRRRAWSFVKQMQDLAMKGRGGLALVVGEQGTGKSTFLKKLELDLGMRGKTRLFLACADVHRRPQTEIADELVRRLREMAKESNGILAMEGKRPSSPDQVARLIVEASRGLDDSDLIVILLDDVGCDQGSINEFLKHLIHMAATERILLIASLDRQGLQVLQGTIPNLVALPQVHRVSFRSFTREETERLVASLLGTDEINHDVIELVYRSSGGNPEIACEVVRQLIAQGYLERNNDGWIARTLPDLQALGAAMIWVVECKLQSLDPVQRRVLGTIALIGAQVPRDVIEEIVQDDFPGLDMALRTLVDQDLVIEGGGGLALRHELLMRAATSVFTDEELVELHTRAGRVIQARWPDDVSWAGIIAFHLAGSGRRAEAFELAVRGADAALREQRHARALQLFSQAETYLADTDGEQEFRVLRGQSTCQMRLWRWSLACDLIARQLAGPYAEKLEVDEHAMMELSYAKALAAQGNGEEATRRLEIVLSVPGLSQAVHLEALAASAQVAAEGRRWTEAEEYARLCLGQFVDIPDHPLRRPVENTLGVALLMSGELEEAQVHLETSYRLREQAGDTLDAARCAMNLGILLRRLGQYTDARRWLDASLSRFESVGAVALQAQALNTQGLLELSSGFPPKATILFQKAVRLALGCGRWRSAGSALNNLGLSLKESSERGQAIRQFQEAMTLARRKGDRSLLGRTAGNLGDCFLEAGDLEMAEGWYTEARTVGQKSDDPQCLGDCMRGFARLRREQRELDQADRYLDEATRALERSGNERSLLHARCELAELRLAQGKTDEALHAAEMAAEKLGEAAPIDEAKVFRLLGKTNAHSGNQEEAAQAFRQCLDLVEATESLEGIALAQLEVGRWLVRNGPVSGFRAAERYLSRSKESFLRMGASLRVKDVDDILDELTAKAGGGVGPGADARRLTSLYRMMTMVNSAQDTGGVLDQILDLAVHAVHGERGLIILLRGDAEDLEIRAKTEMDGATITDARRISETVVKRVAGAGVPVFASDALNDVRFSEHDSIRMNRITCFMCVPLSVRGQIIGTIYIDSCNLAHRFSEDDVSYLTAFANQAAVAMENLRLREELEEENEYLQEQLKSAYSFETLVGHSPAMNVVFKAMDVVARSAVTVVIQGETGTGKELVAKAIHFGGPRSRRKFVPLNCSALPDTLLESELFGHVRGAFTGAVRNVQGLFPLADGGTIFLDEITEMSPNLQAKVLRVLETGEVKQIGQPTTQHVDVRVICATNKDLEKEMLLGRFREDLYYRLKVVVIHIPPLRKRLQDVPLLAVHFLKKYNEQLDRQIRRFSDEAIGSLCSMRWPGNVRELEHAIEAAVALCPGKVIDADTLSIALDSQLVHDKDAWAVLTLLEARRSLERRQIHQALQDTGWNVTASAKRLGVKRRQFQRLMRRYQLGSSPLWRGETIANP